MNYYQILDVSNTATFDEVKKRYQELALKYHPDKNGGIETEKFIEIHKAWNILKDAQKRKEFDSILTQQSLDSCVQLYATLQENELEVESNGDFSYTCRCGGTYVVTPSQLSQTDCIIPCDDCSLAILVIPQKK